MSSIPFFARRRLCSTFNAQEVGQLRAALQDAGVEKGTSPVPVLRAASRPSGLSGPFL